VTTESGEGKLVGSGVAERIYAALKIIRKVTRRSCFVLFNALVLEKCDQPTDGAAFGCILALWVMWWPRWAEASFVATANAAQRASAFATPSERIARADQGDIICRGISRSADDFVEEAGGCGAVDDALIERRLRRHHDTLLDFIVVGDTGIFAGAAG